MQRQEAVAKRSSDIAKERVVRRAAEEKEEAYQLKEATAQASKIKYTKDDEKFFLSKMRDAAQQYVYNVTTFTTVVFRCIFIYFSYTGDALFMWSGALGSSGAPLPYYTSTLALHIASHHTNNNPLIHQSINLSNSYTCTDTQWTALLYKSHYRHLRGQPCHLYLL